MATAGAMWVIDWNRTSVSPIAFRSRLSAGGVSGADADADMDWAIPTSSGRPGACGRRASYAHWQAP